MTIAFGAAFSEISRYQQMMAEIVRKDPAVLSFYSGLSGAGGNLNSGSNFGRFFLHLKPREERDKLDVVMTRLRQKMSGFPFLSRSTTAGDENHRPAPVVPRDRHGKRRQSR